MSQLPQIWHFAAFFAYFGKVRVSHIFFAYFGNLAALNILCSNFSDADDLLLQEVEEVVADGTEFVEFESRGPSN